jgi:hypothetical protein
MTRIPGLRVGATATAAPGRGRQVTRDHWPGPDGRSNFARRLRIGLGVRHVSSARLRQPRGHWRGCSLRNVHFENQQLISFCSCRAQPNSNVKCPVTVADLKHLYNCLIPHTNSKSKADFWSPSGLKSHKDKYSKYQKMYQHRRQTRWNEPFEIHDTLPIVLKEMFGSDWKLGEMKIDMKFTKAVLDFLELDIRMLLSCDLLATKGRNEIRENSLSPDAMAARTRSQLKNRSQWQLTNVLLALAAICPDGCP